MKNRYTWIGLMLLTMLLWATGCGDKGYEPAAIKEGVDKCEVCQMLIKDDHNATQIVLKSKKPLKFDDIGDMFVWLKQNGRDNVGAIYVRDYHTMEWLELANGTYVYDPTNKTPMGFGVYSFKTEADADKFIQEKGSGTKMDAAALETHDWAHTMGGGHGSGHGTGEHGTDAGHGGENKEPANGGHGEETKEPASGGHGG